MIDIITANNERNEFILRQTDVSGAFDRVDRPLLLDILWQAGIKGQVHKLLQSFLSDRFFRVRVAGAASSLRTEEAGICQGSVLGPTLWLIFYAGISRAVQRPGNEITYQPPETYTFADDFNLGGTSLRDIDAGEERATDWAKANRVSMDPKKRIDTNFSYPRHRCGRRKENATENEKTTKPIETD